ncbi:DUF4148 domain-containing protein [Paraburkholderia sp. HD33-4]|uniref:DUF4148 domain-containing protein n=1 Tax=Paraburkholderia sp. HD33-4 TaxID=2883242 RepID=UPI001F34DB3A|nr:DUF4148 domain-containing protein [Paraburkholderia sp. HD33-4]
MKLIKSLIVAAVVAVPAVSFAQSNAALTRAQVRAELIQLEKAGYNPAADYDTYPQNIQAAEARVSAQNGAAAAYGGSANGASAAGAGTVKVSVLSQQQDVAGFAPLYAHH